jgi:hypothetical protein
VSYLLVARPFQVLCEPEMLRNQYLTLRRRYEPEHVKLVLVAESPPASGLYFYNPDGRVTEPLFSALMKQLDVRCDQKSDGLSELQRSGWLLVDATYAPVNRLSDTERRKIIERDFPLLCDDLLKLTPDRSAPLILIKQNVCRILEPLLTHDRFNVLNRGIVVPFPSTGHQRQFHEKFKSIQLRAVKTRPLEEI